MRFWFVLLGLTGCSLLNDLDELSGQPDDTGGAGGATSGGAAGASSVSVTMGSSTTDGTSVSSGGSSVPYSCADQLTRNPASQDGEYIIDPDGVGPITEGAYYCDMTVDGGGWLLVTPTLIESVNGQNVTEVESMDPRGGYGVRVYPNSTGCNATLATEDVFRVEIKSLWNWTQIRARYEFAGSTSCWGIFGDMGAHPTVNLEAFNANVDIVRDAVRMGGSAGDAFSGVTSDCTNESTNFWHLMNGNAPRSAVAILRRKFGEPAGLGTYTTCTQEAPGTSGQTYWEHSEIYIR